MGQDPGAVLGREAARARRRVRPLHDQREPHRAAQVAIGLEQNALATDDWGDANAAKWRLAFFETECDVLFLDDVGKEYRAKSGYSDDQLDLLLRRRVESGLVTCMASNLELPKWLSYNDSMASFLYEVGEIVELVDGRDHRRRTPTAARRRGVKR